MRLALQGAAVRLGGRAVLEAVSFEVQPGRAVALLGPNGRGKTTALRALLGFQKLTAGQRSAPPVVGYVPQSAGIQHRYRVLDMVVMGHAAKLGLFGQPRSPDLSAARAALEQVGIADLAEASVDRLSGGQRQLVLLARALATGSSALVLDEPGAALDLRNQERLLRLIDGLRHQRRHAILFTTHDPNHALVAADEVVMLMPGGEALQGPVAEMLTAERLAQLYGVPMRMVQLDGPDGLPRRAVLPAFAGAMV